jgi:hypothetical protein
VQYVQRGWCHYFLCHGAGHCQAWPLIVEILIRTQIIIVIIIIIIIMTAVVVAVAVVVVLIMLRVMKLLWQGKCVQCV